MIKFYKDFHIQPAADNGGGGGGGGNPELYAKAIDDCYIFVSDEIISEEE